MSRGPTPGGIWPRLLKNTGWLLGARAMNAPLALLESVLLARFLGVAGYGTLGIVMTTVIALQRLFSFRMNEFTVRYLSGALEKGNRRQAGATLKLALGVEAGFAVAACLVAYIAAPTLARYFVASAGAPEWIRLFAFMALANAVLETSSGALQVFDRFRLLAGTSFFRKALLVVGLVLSLAKDGGIQAALLSYIAASLIANAVVLVAVVRTANQEIGPRWWATSAKDVRSQWREMGHFALTTNLGATLSLIIKDSDLLWIGFFRSPEDAGYFKLVTTFLKIPFAAGSPMTKAFYPEIARLVQRSSAERIRHFLRQTTLVAAGWVVPVAVITALLAPFLVRALYGESFLPALPALWILLVGMVMAHIVFWTRPTLLALGRPQIPLKISAINAVLKVGLAITLVPTWGYLALSAILSGLYLNGLSLAVLSIRKELRDFKANG